MATTRRRKRRQKTSRVALTDWQKCSEELTMRLLNSNICFLTLKSFRILKIRDMETCKQHQKHPNPQKVSSEKNFIKKPADQAGHDFNLQQVMGLSGKDQQYALISVYHINFKCLRPDFLPTWSQVVGFTRKHLNWYVSHNKTNWNWCRSLLWYVKSYCLLLHICAHISSDARENQVACPVS